jgi:Skp family chaperone for outer membrane proteins
MKILLLPAALAASVIAPAAASAQSLPPAVIAVVDLERVSSQCTACKAAAAVLQGQMSALRTREQALATPLQAEQKSIQAAIDALPKGAEPPAALQTRVQAFQTRQQQGLQELQREDNQIKRNNAYVSQQISAKLGPIYQQVMIRRGANIMVEIGATLASGAGLDVTNDVLAALNAALPSVKTTAPPQAAPSR